MKQLFVKNRNAKADRNENICIAKNILSDVDFKEISLHNHLYNWQKKTLHAALRLKNPAVHTENLKFS